MAEAGWILWPFDQLQAGLGREERVSGGINTDRAGIAGLELGARIDVEFEFTSEIRIDINPDIEKCC
ncbi:hypothetical protein BY996DRAFT_6502515 [Phakopsora pachyrhizi]|nr:hypothetical protein BY996DRAFT_6502515 [Phakopsora pachyrhizi]